MADKIEWYKAVSPLLMVSVTACATYFGVDQHAQQVATANQQLEQKKFEWEAAQSKKNADLTARNNYLKLAIESPNEVRLRYLRFLALTEADGELKTWASEELTVVQKSIDDLKKDNIKAKKELELAIEERERLKSELILAKATASKISSTNQDLTNKYEKRLEDIQAGLAKATAKATLAKASVDITTPRIHMSPAQVTLTTPTHELTSEQLVEIFSKYSTPSNNSTSFQSMLKKNGYEY